MLINFMNEILFLYTELTQLQQTVHSQSRDLDKANRVCWNGGGVHEDGDGSNGGGSSGGGSGEG